MANTDKNILITPNIGSSTDDPKIVFSGADASTAAQNISMKVYPTNSGTLSIEGSVGQLFSVTNTLSGTIYSVNDISGIPSIEVLDTGLIKLGQYGGNILFGTATDNGQKLQVAGVTALGTNLANYLTVTGAASASSVSITTAGSDTNIGLTISTKGSGSIIIDTGTGAGDIDLKPGTSSLRIWDDNSTHYYRLLTGDRTANYDLSFPAATGTFLIANSTANSAGYFDTGTTTPTGTTRLNYSGYFYPSYINLVGSADTTTAATHYFVETATDGYVRPKPLANVLAEIGSITAGSTSVGPLRYNGTTSTAGQFDGGTTNPAGTTRLNYGGALYVNSLYSVGNVTAYSDSRLKENIVGIEAPLEKVMKLRGVYYNMISDDSKTRKVGVIAQEIKEVLPEVVKCSDSSEHDSGIYSVDYGNITAVLIEAIKEQQEIIEKQEERIARLEMLVQQLIGD